MTLHNSLVSFGRKFRTACRAIQQCGKTLRGYSMTPMSPELGPHDSHPHFVLEYVPSTFDEIYTVYTGNMYRHMTGI